MKNLSKRIWFGSDERIFDVLPANVLANFRSPRSENALLWNRIYRIAAPTIAMRKLLSVKPLWGTQGQIEEPGDKLRPYFWGFDIAGSRMAKLDEVLSEIDGPGPSTEVDLFLLGAKHLIAVEAKHTSGFGRCGRYLRGRCPEIHPETASDEACRYWDDKQARFEQALRMGERPEVESDAPLCSRHYQLSRTLLIGQKLAAKHARIFSLWAIVSEKGWRSLELDWLDFSDRVRDSGLWRRMRVVSWEALGGLG